MSTDKEKTFEIKAKITLKDNEVVIINKIPFSKALLQELSNLFDSPDYREDVICGLAGHMWLLTRLEEDAPFGDHNETFFMLVNNLYDSLKEYEHIREFQYL